MQRLLSVRIVHWYKKIAFVVVIWGAVGWLLIGQGLRALHLNGNIVGVAGAAFDLALVLYCARVFRGKEEPTDRDRPLWQMTSHGRLSRRLGVLSTVIAGICLLAFVVNVIKTAGKGPETNDLVSVALYGVLALLYLRSGHRLRSSAVAH